MKQPAADERRAAAPGRRYARRLAQGGLLFLLLSSQVAEEALAVAGAGLGAAAPTAPRTVTLTLTERIATARRQLPVARAMRQALDDPANLPPPGIPSRELDAARAMADRLVLFSESHLRSLEAQQRARAEQRNLAATQRLAMTPEGPPPYSILAVDGVADRLAAAERALRSTRRQIDAGTRRLEEFRLTRDTAERELRLAAETMERAQNGRPVAEWRWRCARLRLESAEAVLAWSLSELELLEAALELEQAKAAAIADTLARVRRGATFLESDLATAQARLDQQYEALEREFTQMMGEHKRLEREASSAQRRAEHARHPGGAGTPHAQPATAEDELRVLEARRASARAQGEMMTIHLTALRAMREAWSQRYTLLEHPDVVKRKEAASWLRASRARARTLLVAARADAASYQAEAAVSVDRLLLLRDTDRAAAAGEEAVLEAIRAKQAVSQRQQHALGGMADVVTRWLRDAAVELEGEALAERASDGLAQARLLLRRAWQFELMTVDDTMKIGGEHVAVQRPVTVAKIASVVVVLLAGYWMSMFAINRLHRMLIERFAIGEAQAAVLRRWLFASCLVGLVLVAMSLVRVPLTAFAFLGGALAIGFGFGTQTLIKNLVSGVLLLLERQIRTGDIVQIGGILGAVDAVDIRSTRVRGFDGRETLIPNSVFLDSNVTNWTLSSRRVELEIDIAVHPHAIPSRVAEVILQCAQRNPRVLVDPPAVVQLRSLGAHALEFALLIWVELGPTETGKGLASDLRFMLDAALRANGIALATPPQDLFMKACGQLLGELAVPRRDASGA